MTTNELFWFGLLFWGLSSTTVGCATSEEEPPEEDPACGIGGGGDSGVCPCKPFAPAVAPETEGASPGVDYGFRLGGRSIDGLDDMVLLADGSIGVAGHYQAETNFGGDYIKLPSATTPGSYAGILNRNGFWVKGYTFPANTTQRIASDGSGALYLAGTFSGSLQLSGQTLESVMGTQDVVVFKVDGSGSVLWAKSVGADTIDSPMSLHSDGAGNVTVVVDRMSGGGNAGAIYRFDPAGNESWRLDYATGDFALGGGALASDGSLVFTGSLAKNTLLVAAVSNTGSEMYAQTFSSTGLVSGKRTLLMPSGDIAVLGRLDGSLDLGLTSDDLSAQNAPFVAVFNSDASDLKWRHDLSDRFRDASDLSALDTALAVVGTGPDDALTLVKLDSAGYAYKLGVTNGLAGAYFGSAPPSRVLSDGSGPDVPVVVGSTFAGGIDLGGRLLQARGCEDVFVASFSHGMP